MDDSSSYQPEPVQSPLTPAADQTEQLPESNELTPEQKRTIIGVIIAFVILVALVIVSVIYLLQPATDTAKIRDVFIIFMALQSMLTGITLVILMIQLARLINLLQNEIKPILDSTNETVSNLRGTTTFLSDNLVEPVIKLNEYLAGFSQLLLALGLVRKSKK
jgi:hypothetical protein